ncbi:hypothetical protein [Phytoactinopolyspora endophytica]|uniref:hypothetical protein n=1 Tax=Phytoactinopolyspora endophytica TaxID=1642495 RepID=UPI00101C5CF6|nr:hypothetical protein [Phytoactinopolyspora endophytica]
MNRTKTMTSVLGATALALLLAACGSDDGANPFAGIDNADGNNAHGDDDSQAASDAYCDRTEAFGEGVLQSATFSNPQQAESVAGELRKIADLAPDQAVADDWNLLADGIEALSDSEDGARVMHLDMALVELSENFPDEYEDVDVVDVHINKHLRRECQHPGVHTVGESDEQEQDPEEDPGQDVDAVPTGGYCDLAAEFNDTMTNNAGVPDADLLDAYAGAARELAGAAPDQAIADDWNAMAGFFEAAANIDFSDPYALDDLQQDWDFDQMGERLDEHATRECR